MPTGIPLTDKSIFAPGVLYLVKNYKNMDLKDLEKETCLHGLDLGDFFFYNLMVSFVLSSLTSIEMKIFVGIGCIIFIKIGYTITKWISLLLYGKRNGPALPLPVITFTAYTILLNVFVGDFDSDLC